MSGSARTFARRLLVGVSLLALVGCAAIQPTLSPSESPSPTPSPTASAVASPIATSTVAPIAPTTTPTATALESTPPSEEPSSTPTGSPGSLQIPGTPFANIGSSWGSFAWSPTGEWLLLRQSGDRVSLIAATDMSIVRTYSVPNEDYADSTWIDATSFFVYSSKTTGSHFSGTAYVGTVSESGLVQAQIAWDHEENGTGPIALSNGRGAVAFWSGYEYLETCGGFCPRYRVWADGSLSDERLGEPIAWSPDGTRLAVIHPINEKTSVDSGGNVAAAGVNFNSGWLEVLSYPQLKPVYSDHDLVVDDTEPAFSPSGKFLLVESADDEVVDPDKQTVTQSPTDWPTYWYGDDNLMGSNGTDLVEHALDGSVVGRWNGIGNFGFRTSGDGRLLVTTDQQRSPRYIEVIRDGRLLSFKLPDLAQLNGINLVMPTPADDGRSVVLITETPEHYGPLLVLQVPS